MTIQESCNNIATICLFFELGSCYIIYLFLNFFFYIHVANLLEFYSESAENMGAEGELVMQPKVDPGESSSGEYTFREIIYGEEALRISSLEPYCLSRPIRRGHFNVSPHYPHQQVFPWTKT